MRLSSSHDFFRGRLSCMSHKCLAYSKGLDIGANGFKSPKYHFYNSIASGLQLIMPRYLLRKSSCPDQPPLGVDTDMILGTPSRRVIPAKQDDLSALARDFDRLPPEIIHQIFNHLLLSDILLLASDSPCGGYVHDCVRSYLPYQSLFPNPESLINVLDLFSLYYEMSVAFGGLQPWPLRRFTVYDPTKLRSMFHPGYHTGSVYFCLHKYILGLLCQPTGLSLNLLDEYSAELSYKWNSERLSALNLDAAKCKSIRQRCVAIHTAEKSFNRTRSVQLLKMADLLIQFPTMLKKASDPSQIRRRNNNHVALRLRKEAYNVLHDQPLTLHYRPREWFMFDHFALVPFDSCLELFVHMLDKYPLDGGVSNIYPISIVRDIHTAIEGLAYVYTLSDLWTGKKPEILRTKHTPYSATPFNSYSGDYVSIFTSPPHQHFYRLEPWRMGQEISGDKNKYRLQPHHEKEIIWLGAFLRACAYMQDSMSSRRQEIVYRDTRLVETHQTKDDQSERGRICDGP